MMEEYWITEADILSSDSQPPTMRSERLSTILGHLSADPRFDVVVDELRRAAETLDSRHVRTAAELELVLRARPLDR
jgi:hypothetical protein